MLFYCTVLIFQPAKPRPLPNNHSFLSVIFSSLLPLTTLRMTQLSHKYMFMYVFWNYALGRVYLSNSWEPDNIYPSHILFSFHIHCKTHSHFSFSEPLHHLHSTCKSLNIFSLITYMSIIFSIQDEYVLKNRDYIIVYHQLAACLASSACSINHEWMNKFINKYMKKYWIK